MSDRRTNSFGLMQRQRGIGLVEIMIAVTLGIIVPFFFVASGIDFNLPELFTDLGDVIRLPLFIAALLLVHLVPAALYLRSMSRPMAIAAGCWRTRSGRAAAR